MAVDPCALRVKRDHVVDVMDCCVSFKVFCMSTTVVDWSWNPKKDGGLNNCFPFYLLGVCVLQKRFHYYMYILLLETTRVHGL